MRYHFILIFTLISLFVSAQSSNTYSELKDLSYYPDSIVTQDSYIEELAVLDLYYPTDKDNFATVVWFHGGGLTSGDKAIPRELKERGVAVVSVGYRLSPKVKVTSCIEDAAAAVAWVFNNIDNYGGDRSKIFVSGHSAGGYLTSMVGLDKSWLAKHNMDADQIAGLIPFSGHAITHFTVRKEMGLGATKVIVDNYAPLDHIRNDAPPMLLITGDRELEMLGRYEENAYMMRMMKVVGHKDIRLMELDGYDHGAMAKPAFPLLLNEMKRILKLKR